MNQYGHYLSIEGPPRFVGWSNKNGYQQVDPDHMPHTLDECARDFLAFMDEFYDLYPAMKSKTLYLTGESFAGEYLAFYASALLRRNNERTASGSSDVVKLGGVMAGNAVFSRKTSPKTDVDFLCGKLDGKIFVDNCDDFLAYAENCTVGSDTIRVGDASRENFTSNPAQFIGDCVKPRNKACCAVRDLISTSQNGVYDGKNIVQRVSDSPDFCLEEAAPGFPPIPAAVKYPAMESCNGQLGIVTRVSNTKHNKLFPVNALEAPGPKGNVLMPINGQAMSSDVRKWMKKQYNVSFPNYLYLFEECEKNGGSFPPTCRDLSKIAETMNDDVTKDIFHAYKGAEWLSGNYWIWQSLYAAVTKKNTWPRLAELMSSGVPVILYYGKDDYSVTRNRGYSDAHAIWETYDDAQYDASCRMVDGDAIENSDELVPYYDPSRGYNFSAWPQAGSFGSTNLGMTRRFGEMQLFGDRLLYVQVEDCGHEVAIQNVEAFQMLMKTLVGFRSLDSVCAIKETELDGGLELALALGSIAFLLLVFLPAVIIMGKKMK